MMILKEFSRIVCVSLFSYQGSLLTILRQLVYFISFPTVCQELFQLFQNFFIQEVLKRRRRDLNPRAAINDLLPFQGSPFGQLGYFSKLPYAIALVYFFTRSVLYYIALFFFCQELFFDFFQNLFCS